MEYAVKRVRPDISDPELQDFINSASKDGLEMVSDAQFPRLIFRKPAASAIPADFRSVPAQQKNEITTAHGKNRR